MLNGIGCRCGIGLAALFVGIGAQHAAAQEAFPNGPITIVVNTSPGSSIDRFARQVAEQIGPIVRVSAVVDNREGGNGTLALEFLQRRPADGHTLGAWSITYSGVLAQDTLPYGADDFVPICRLLSNPYSLWVRADRFETLDDFIAEAKAEPGGIRVSGGGGPGSSVYVAASHIQEALGIEFVWIPFDGSAEADLAVMSGDADATVGSTRVPEGARMLALTGPKRDPYVPEIPTFEELGYNVPDISWRGIIAKSGTPESTIGTIEAALLEMAETEAWKEFAVELQGTENIVCGEPFRQQIENEIADLRQD